VEKLIAANGSNPAPPVTPPEADEVDIELEIEVEVVVEVEVEVEVEASSDGWD